MVDSEQFVEFDSVASLLQGPGLQGVALPHFAKRNTSPAYVTPRFAVISNQENVNVVLVSARGAAGKSTTANALSNQLEAPVWRLEEDKSVSHDSVYATLGRYLTSVDPLDQIRKLRNPVAIIDSTDEARTRVTASAWDEYVGAIADSVGAGLRLYVFGRTQTITDLWAALEDLGVRTCWFEISHFDRDSAIRYVDSRSVLVDGDVDISNSAYIEARDAVLESLHDQPVDGDSEVFVGYPPVLDAVSALLVKRANLQEVKNSFSDHSFSRRIEVLKGILDHLVERDRAKISPLLDELNLPNGIELYGPIEQLTWVLHHVDGLEAPTLPAVENSPVERDYRARIAEFYRDHPFVSGDSWASPVFKAYAIWCLFDKVPGSIAIDVGKESGILFELVSGLSAQPILLDEELLAALHSSMLSGKTSGLRVGTSLSNEEGELGVQFTVEHDDSAGGQAREVIDAQLLPDDPDEIQILGPACYLDISVSGGVRVDPRGRELYVGPELSIICDNLELVGTSVSFERPDEDDAATEISLEARKRLRMPHEITGRPPIAGALEIIAPSDTSLSYPWINYESVKSEDLPDIDDRAVRLLKKLMNLTRTHGHKGDRAVYLMKFKGRQCLPTADFKSALDVLTQFGVVRLDGDMVYVNKEWEVHRFDGKATEGPRSLSAKLDAWRPVLVGVSEKISDLN